MFDAPSDGTGEQMGASVLKSSDWADEFVFLKEQLQPGC